VDKDSALIASAVRSGSFRISSPRQTLNQETDCVFPADNQRGGAGIGRRRLAAQLTAEPMPIAVLLLLPADHGFGSARN
jgi:hypothetical protein